MIKAAFFDIDGTLLSFKTHKVSDGTIRAFDELRRRGVRTFISSGRPKVLIPPMPLHFDGYVTMNGGYVFTDDKVLLRNPIPQDETRRWVEYAKDNKLCAMVFTEKAMYASNINDVAERLRNQLDFQMPPIVPIDELSDKEAYQIIAVMPAERDEEVRKILPHCHMPRWHSNFTDVIHRDNSKAVGLEALCRHYGIGRGETMAIGDGANDIEMLQWAAIGIAMGNSDEEVKQAADRTTTTVDEEGIEQAVAQLISEGLI